ncbi:MAG TPA: hypothetical protein VNE18_12005 [Rhodanobacter sp.]|nr:hypothetical protein [Rhodanobacter sp.]
MRRTVLLSTTCVWRALAAIKWWELFLVSFIKSGQRNNGHVLMNLMKIEHPMFFSLAHVAGGGVEVVCEPGLVTEKLHIGGFPRFFDQPAANDA